MADTTNLNLCILWEDELREAARLIQAAHADGLDDEARGKAMGHAFNAATVALWGLTDDHACVLVGSGDIRKSRNKRRSADTSCPDAEKP